MAILNDITAIGKAEGLHSFEQVGISVRHCFRSLFARPVILCSS